MTEPWPGRTPFLARLRRLLWLAALLLPAFGAQAGVVSTTATDSLTHGRLGEATLPHVADPLQKMTENTCIVTII
jgi:hypothetical protein